MNHCIRKQKNPVIPTAVILCLFVALAVSSCAGDSGVDRAAPPPPLHSDENATPSSGAPSDEPPVQTPEKPSAPPEPEAELVQYSGAVEHLFFHEVIAWPERAFDGDNMQRNYDTNMITVSEYAAILESLYSKGYTLVDLNNVWSEYTDENGKQRMRKNTLMLPEGKKPLVLSFDDLSFYTFMSGDGFMERYIIGEDGDVWAAGVDPNGKTIISQDLTVVTILDKFVKENPGFSTGGAKGCIALTGYEGILGYRTQNVKENDTQGARLKRMQEIARVRPVVQRLKETGWYFSTHSYGHIWIDNITFDEVRNDALRWLDEVGSLVGETKIFIYPYGSRLDGGDVWNTGPALQFYNDHGFRFFASVGYEPFSRIKPDIPAVMLDRMAVDGNAIRNRRATFSRFFDAAEVFDQSRPNYGVTW